MRIFWWFGALLGLGGASVHAADVEVGPADDWRGAIAALQPGDTVWMRGGTYAVSTLFRIQRTGTASQPIAVRAVSGARPHIVQSGQQNVIEIDGSSHLLLEGLEVSGGAGVGVRILTANDVTLRNLLIRDVPEAGIAANTPGGTATRLVVEGVEIRQARRGIDLGCSAAACITIDAVIRRNWIHDLADSVTLSAFGLRISAGSSGALVEDNVFHDVDLGLFLLSTLANGNPHQVRRNFIWNTRDVAVELVSHTLFENNVVLGSTAAAGLPSVSVRNNQATSTVITVRNNTVISPGASAALRLRQVTGSTLIANNALFSQLGAAIDIASSSGISVIDNAGEGSVSGTATGFTTVGPPATVLSSASYAGTVPQDLVPVAGSPLIGAANFAFAPAGDFDEVTRDTSPDIGALERRGDALDRWTPAPGFKRAPRIFGSGFEE